MLKAIILMPRRDDLSPAEFERHLRERHLPLVAQMPGLRRLVLNLALPDPNGPPPAWDAAAEDWFDGPEAWGAALASPARQAVLADAPNFLDMTRIQFLVANEEDIPLPTGTAAPAG